MGYFQASGAFARPDVYTQHSVVKECNKNTRLPGVTFLNQDTDATRPSWVAPLVGHTSIPQLKTWIDRDGTLPFTES
jgi:hypothetical protein